MITRAKVKCIKIELHESGGRIVLNPVTATNEENSKFFKWTPSGSIDLGIVNQDTIGNFIPGNEYYVDFIPVEANIKKH